MAHKLAFDRIAAITALAFLVTVSSRAQSQLSIKWEELTAPDFVKAIQQAQATCLLPIGILEKHGAHLPLGNDLINVRYLSEHAQGRSTQSYFQITTSDKFSKPVISPVQLRTARACSSIFCKRLPTKWGATVARRSSL